MRAFTPLVVAVRCLELKQGGFERLTSCRGYHGDRCSSVHEEHYSVVFYPMHWASSIVFFPAPGSAASTHNLWDSLGRFISARLFADPCFVTKDLIEVANILIFLSLPNETASTHPPISILKSPRCKFHLLHLLMHVCQHLFSVSRVCVDRFAASCSEITARMNVEKYCHQRQSFCPGGVSSIHKPWFLTWCTYLKYSPIASIDVVKKLTDISSSES